MEIKLNEMNRTKEGDQVEIGGKVTFTGVPREGEYGISQWIVIKQGEDKQGCWVYLGSIEEKIIKGTSIKLKGTVKEFMDKNNKPTKSVNGKLIDEVIEAKSFRDEDGKVSPAKQTIEQPTEQPVEKPATPPTQAYMSKDDYWRDKTLREIENSKCIVRECAIKAVTELIGTANMRCLEVQEWYFGFANKIVDYIYDKLGEKLGENKITSEGISGVFGGKVIEEKLKEQITESANLPPTEDNPFITGKTKEQLIEEARETVKKVEDKDSFIRRNPHLTEPINDKMATVAQKKQIYGYINEKGEKIGGVVDSQYITKLEVKNIGKAGDLKKADAIRYWEYWYGKDEEVGERAKREIAAREKEQGSFERKPLEKQDKNDNSSLAKDLLVEQINKLRKENALEDDEKFTKELGCNVKFKLWTEKELTKLKEKLEIYKPNWVTE